MHSTLIYIPQTDKMFHLIQIKSYAMNHSCVDNCSEGVRSTCRREIQYMSYVTKPISINLDKEHLGHKASNAYNRNATTNVFRKCDQCVFSFILQTS